MIFRHREKRRRIPAPLGLMAGLVLVLGLLAMTPPRTVAAAAAPEAGSEADKAAEAEAVTDAEDAPAQGSGAPTPITPPRVRRQLDPAILARMRERLVRRAAPAPSPDASIPTPKAAH